MSKDKFDRGITDPFVDALNNEYRNDSWWRKIADDKDLFLGIRDDYLNVYYNGASILRLTYNNYELAGKVHFKYLINLEREEAESDYVGFKDGTFNPVDLSSSYQDISAGIQGIKKSASAYQKEEKIGVHKIIMKNINIIDTEIQLPGEKRRIDFAALQKADGVIKIVFFEAKTYSNNELRSKKENRPKVLDQVEAYQKIIYRRRDEIVESYQCVARNIDCMSGWKDRRCKIFSQVTPENLTIDPEVRIAIFGYDEAQRKAAEDESTGTFARLRKDLGKHRVLTTGDPGKFSRGIESSE